MNSYSVPYPLLDGNNGADTPGAFFFRRKNKKTTPPSTTQQSQSASSSTYEPSIAPSDATTLVPDAKNDKTNEDLGRPTAPAQGSRDSPWSSYCDLPSEHPVFGYSDEMRAELYERGIDPVVQAEADAAKENGADGTANGFWKQSVSRLKTFAAC